MAALEQINITGGDSKEKLLAQLFDIGRVSNRPCFFLDVESPVGQKPILVLINGLEAEDGSGDRWMIYGYIMFPQIVTDLVPWLAGYKRSFKGFYDTRTRKGYLTPRS